MSQEILTQAVVHQHQSFAVLCIKFEERVEQCHEPEGCQADEDDKGWLLWLL